MSLGASLLPSTDTARGLPRSRDYGVDLGSEVYRMLREPAEPSASASEPKQSGSFRYLQGMLEAGEGGKTPANLPHLPHTPSGALKSSAPPPLLCDPPPPPPRAASQPSAPAASSPSFPTPFAADSHSTPCRGPSPSKPRPQSQCWWSRKLGPTHTAQK